MPTVNDDPKTGIYASLLYSVQVSKGTAVAPATAAGMCRFDVTDDTDMRVLRTIGSEEVLFLKPGIQRVDFSITIEQIQTFALLLQAERTNGALPWLTLGFGIKDSAGNLDGGWQVQDCKIHRVQLEWEEGGFLSATLSGVGGLISNFAYSAANLTPTPLHSYEALFLKGGAAYDIRRVSLNIDHNVRVRSKIAGTARTSFKRGWDFQTEGPVAVNGEVQRYASDATNLQADTIADFALQIKGTDIIGGVTPNTLTVDVTGAKWTQERRSVGPDADYEFSYPFEAKGFNFTQTN